MSVNRDFGQSMGVAGHLYIDVTQQLLRPHDLTYPQFTVLLYLARRAEAARMSDIARAVTLTQSAATKVVQKFISAGLVTAGRDVSDARNRPILLTTKGEQKIGAVQAAFGPAFEQVFAGFSSDELKVATDILQRLIVGLDGARKNLQA